MPACYRYESRTACQAKWQAVSYSLCSLVFKPIVLMWHHSLARDSEALNIRFPSCFCLKKESYTSQKPAGSRTLFSHRWEWTAMSKIKAVTVKAVFDHPTAQFLIPENLYKVNASAVSRVCLKMEELNQDTCLHYFSWIDSINQHTSSTEHRYLYKFLCRYAGNRIFIGFFFYNCLASTNLVQWLPQWKKYVRKNCKLSFDPEYNFLFGAMY